MCDRTREFLFLVEGLSRANPVPSTQRKQIEPPKSRTAFNEAASEIAKGIHRTSTILTKLTKLVRKQGLFDEPTEEINGLILRLKHDLDDLNNKCDSAQQYVDEKKRSLGENQQSAYNGKVVTQLKSELLNATKGFKSVIEVHSNKMKDKQNRKIQLTGTANLSPMKQFQASINQQSAGSSQPMAMANPYSMLANSSTNVDNITSFLQQQSRSISSDPQFSYQPQQQQQQLLLASPVSEQYYESRSEAVNEIQKTIQELGTLFTRLSTMINEQQELVERIDQDIETATDNADRAKGMLMKTLESASSNTGLYTKIFGILAVFILFFVLVLM